ncbi:unnamed protein product, partial [Sphagnum compactum]
MAILTTALDLVLPPTTAFLLLLLYPALSFIRWIKFLIGLLVCEDVRGKVILITGASSGIGEHMTYQYAKRGARLVIVARREYLLKQVAGRAMKKGAVDVHVIVADVAKQEDCKRFVDETVNKYGRLDHLVNNAGLYIVSFSKQLKARLGCCKLWMCQGKILVTDSIASVIPHPRQSIYNAAKAALLQFFETLRVEVGDTIGITIVMPGMIESDITKGKFVSDEGELSVKPPDQRDAHLGPIPVAYAEDCARAAVLGVLRSRRYVVVP